MILAETDSTYVDELDFRSCGRTHLAAGPTSGVISIVLKPPDGNGVEQGKLTYSAGRHSICYVPLPRPTDDYTDVFRGWNDAGQRFVDRIRCNINDDTAETAEKGGIGPTQEARNACLGITSILATDVASSGGLKYAAFVEEEGGISLVLQSDVTRRRVNFRVSPGGTELVVVTVDSKARTASVPTQLNDRTRIRGWAEWLSQTT